MKTRIWFCLLVFFVSLETVLAGPAGAAYADQEEKKKAAVQPISNLLELPFDTAGTVVSSVFDLGKIVISPTRTVENVESIGSSISVFTKEELDTRGITTAKEALRKDTGVDVVQSGHFGGVTSIFLRGANSGHTRVMIDGVRMYDPMSTNGAFDLAHTNLDNVRQIEVVRGPQSSLYGSDAMGGIVNIITNQGSGKPKITLYGEAGSYYTYREGVDWNGQIGPTRFALTASRMDTRGISRATGKLGNYEEDPYSNDSYSARVDYDLSESLSVGYIGRYTYADYEYDDGFGVLDDDNIHAWSRQMVSSVVFNHQFSENIGQKLQVSLTANHRRDFDDNDSTHTDDYLRDWYYGDTRQVDWTGTCKLFEVNTFVTGVNYLKERGESYYYTPYGESVFPKRYAETTGYFAEYRFNLNDRIAATANGRLEDHSTFGVNDTYKFDVLWRVPHWETKLRAATGTGFKAPTLYQLYAPPDQYFGGGNTELKPEESESYEIGVEQPFASDKLTFGVTYFHNNFDNLIDAVYNPDTFFTDKYKNVSRAESYGFEVPFGYNYSQRLQMVGNFTWLETKDKDTGAELLRRARHKFNIDFNLIPWERWNLNLDVSYVGHRFDSGNRLLKSYLKADLNIACAVSESYSVYLRIENLTDERYEETKNIGVPGISAYGGVKAKF